MIRPRISFCTTRIKISCWVASFGLFVAFLHGAIFEQSSPKATFRIESEPKAPPPGIEGTDVADFVVSTADPKVREPLDDHPEPACAEPLGEYPPEAQSKERYEAADRRVNELFPKLLKVQERQLEQSTHDEQSSDTQRQINREQVKSTRAAQAGWVNIRERGAKLFAQAGPKGDAGRRYWLHMANSTEARAAEIQRQLEPDSGE